MNAVVTCVFCGKPYPSGTPTHGAQILKDHILQCEAHPIREVQKALEEERAKSIRLEKTIETYWEKEQETTIGPDWKKDQLYKKAQSLKENLVLQHAFEAASIIMDLQHRIADLTRKLQEEGKAE